MGGSKGGGAQGEIGSQVLTGGAINVMPESVQGPMKGAIGTVVDPIGIGNMLTGTGGGKNDYTLTGGKGAKGGGGGGGENPLVVGGGGQPTGDYLGTNAGSIIKSPLLGRGASTEDARTAAQTGKPVSDLGVYRALLAQAVGGLNASA